MDSTKYIGLDVHKETISIAVLNSSGKLVMETIIETKASMLVQFVQGLRGNLHVTFEEGTWAAWLYDLLKPQVTKIVVCDPRRNALLKEGNKSDRIDARKLAELLYLNRLNPVYHGEHGLRALKELVRRFSLPPDPRILSSPGNLRRCGSIAGLPREHALALGSDCEPFIDLAEPIG